MDSRKIVLRETGVLLAGQFLCVGAMFGIYALLRLFTWKVLLGGVLGMLLAVLNFFFMAVFAAIAADKAQAQDVAGGKRVLRLSQTVRYLAVFALLIVIGVSDLCELIATALPLVFTQPIVSVAAFFRKTGEQGK